MMSVLLLTYAVSIPHAPGWSEPVPSIETRLLDVAPKYLLVTDNNHVHQFWSRFDTKPRIGHNIVLPDGTIILPDTMLSRDVSSGYPGAFIISTDSIAVFWREVTPTWYTLLSNDGGTLMPPTLLFDEPWGGGSSFHKETRGDSDSFGLLHLIRPGYTGFYFDELLYSVVEPGGSTLRQDTVPGMLESGLIIVNGDRVHIKFDGMDQLADYMQYDLEGNIVIPPMDVVENVPPVTGLSGGCAMCLDSNGDVMMVIMVQRSGLPRQLRFYKIDAETGTMLVDGLVLYTSDYGLSILSPYILPGPTPECFYIVWLQDDSEGRPVLIMCAVVDSEGEFVEEPYVAYNNSAGYNFYEFTATSNSAGDVFLAWDTSLVTPPELVILLGWFDHNWLGVEDDSPSMAGPQLLLSSSCNPFSSSVTISCEGEALPGQLMVYDITGRLIRSLSDREGSSFLWDGRDGSGAEVPTGSYIIQGAVDGRATSIKVIRL